MAGKDEEKDVLLPDFDRTVLETIIAQALNTPGAVFFEKVEEGGDPVLNHPFPAKDGRLYDLVAPLTLKIARRT